MMEIVHTISEIRQRVAQARKAGKSIGVVPTMGALHDGHGTLIETAGQGSDFVVVTIFVNPLQFGPSEDLERYPRDLEADARFCAERGAHVIFAPSTKEMYPREMATAVTVDALTNTLCGVSRPGHFRGVATVVTKLFNIVQPDYAYFGQKDAQQLAVISRMVADLNIPVEIVKVPIVRESDGLALSSRNAYLSPAERQAAVVLYQALQAAIAKLEAGERNADALRDFLCDTISREPLARIDYAEVVDVESLQRVSSVQRSVLLAVAVYFGKTRLIDNMQFTM
jgi:pantoate--beta-alanine ligase